MLHLGKTSPKRTEQWHKSLVAKFERRSTVEVFIVQNFQWSHKKQANRNKGQKFRFFQVSSIWILFSFQYYFKCIIFLN